jgi:acetyl-CoA C-acetyltransferase
LGVEKLKDTGYGGLPNWGSDAGTLNWLISPNLTAPGAFAQLATAYAAKYGYSIDELKRAMAHVSSKSHANGALNPKAHLRKPVSIQQVLYAPMVAHPLGLFDCCGVSDGAACAIVTTPEFARKLGKGKLVSVKALEIALSSGEEIGFNRWDGTYFMTTSLASKRAYAQAGISDPRRDISLMEVHDCFSITELVTMEDLHISERGCAPRDILSGFYDRDGQIPCQIDGGLKCFGHPIAASGLRMLYEMYLQFQGRAQQRQLDKPLKFALTHNLGGLPSMSICSIAILGYLNT